MVSFGSELVSEEVEVEARVQEGDLAAVTRKQLIKGLEQHGLRLLRKRSKGERRGWGEVGRGHTVARGLWR